MNNSKRSQADIEISNASEHNLKNLSFSVPKNSFILVTGPSGSGKSSLVNDVIAAEARRRYLEQFNPRVRTLLSGIRRPEVDHISGLSPVISVDQLTAFHQIRSTVGTLSGLYDTLRLLFARYAQSENPDQARLTRAHFSFNTSEGQCKVCHGIGETEYIDPSTFIVQPEKSIRNGALSLTTPTGYVIYSQVTLDVLDQVCQAEGFSVDVPWNQLTDAQKNVIYYGSEAIRVPFGKHTLESRMKWTGITAKPREEGYFRGMLTIMEEILKRDRNKNILKYTAAKPCAACHGFRISTEALGFVWHSRNIGEWARMSVDNLVCQMQSIAVSGDLLAGEARIVQSIIEQGLRIQALGIDYLTLDREAGTLSHGESKRLKISTVLQPGMSGLLYTIDEPTVGLHPADHGNLLKLLRELTDHGNTVFCIDHKLFGFSMADHWIEIGPGAGVNGGHLLVNEALHSVHQQPEIIRNSVTWPFLSRRRQLTRQLRAIDSAESFYCGPLTRNNLQQITPGFYRNRLNMICGVSGAGKTSLLLELASRVQGFTKIIEVDQTPIGRTPRSNPMTYTKLSDVIRDLFAATAEAREASLNKSHFSFNVDGGRCPACLGAGKTELGLSYLGKVESDCDVCMGKRFNPEVLAIRYQGKNIHEVLEMDIDEALAFFAQEPKLNRGLKLLADLGLGYLHLGQSSNTLSGGEAQRIKLVAELLKGREGNNLYLLDEPTNGLHYADIQVLLVGLDNLLDQKSTIIAIEHDPYVISLSDWIVELGPGSGVKGGNIVFMGTPGQIRLQESPMGVAIHHAETGDLIGMPRAATGKNRIFPMKLYGVSTHNLKNLSLEIPVNQIVAITGPSGSGKTSLAFDTLYELSRYLYSQAFSTYIQTLIAGNPPGQIDSYQHILPAIGIESRQVSRNSFSTVGSLLGLFPKIRLLFSRFALNDQGNTSDLWGRHFSFQDPSGACETCEGLGLTMTTDESHLVKNPDLTIAEGAMAHSRPGKFFSDPLGQYYAIYKAMCAHEGIPPDKIWKCYTPTEKQLILLGTGTIEYDVVWEFRRGKRQGSHEFTSVWKGFIPLIREDYEKKKTNTRSAGFDSLMIEKDCQVCEGRRLKPERQTFRIGKFSIGDWSMMPFSALSSCLSGLIRHPETSGCPKQNVRVLVDMLADLHQTIELVNRLHLDYLHLLRRADTLSSGEYQRIRLIGQLSAGLTGMAYIIDEPGATLPKENLEDLHQLFSDLRAAGNTVIFTDHRRELIDRADSIISLGPGGGINGGHLMVDDVIEEAIRPIGGQRKDFDPQDILIRLNQVRFRNLLIEQLKIPRGWVSLSGVSGSGKSSLINGVLIPALGDQGFIVIHLGEISKQWTWRDTPLRALGLEELPGRLLEQTAAAKAMGLKAKDFIRGSKNGACPTCLGKGHLVDSLDFLGQSIRDCPICGGTGYKTELTGFQHNAMTIADFDQAELLILPKLFPENRSLNQIAAFLQDLDLDYLKAGQLGNTLSTGERQRLTLVRALVGASAANTVYVMDEPTRGLHQGAISGYIRLIRGLLEKGSSVISVDHDPVLIKHSDWNIRLGPGAGADGGKVVQEGVPE